MLQVHRRGRRPTGGRPSVNYRGNSEPAASRTAGERKQDWLKSGPKGRERRAEGEKRTNRRPHVIRKLLLGLYESNLPSPSLNLEHIIGSIVWKVRFMHRRSRGRSEASIAKRSAERAAAQQQRFRRPYPKSLRPDPAEYSITKFHNRESYFSFHGNSAGSVLWVRAFDSISNFIDQRVHLN